MGQLLDELKRRNVFRVGTAYLVVSWLVIQVVDILEPRMDLPDWIAGLVILLLIVGFPIAVLFAWAFEMTPEGVKKTKDVDLTTSVTEATGRKLDFMIIGALVLGLGYFVWESRFAAAPDAENEITASTDGVQQASIAVLPFVNMSNDPDQEFFSDGISEEILNVLAKIPGLHVTSRSSAFQFRGNDIHIPTVARQLGVANVLEGSVRKAGTQIRITAQLIEADSDKHLWSETYDRELTDVFAIQDEISAAIVDALKVHLGAAGEAAPEPETGSAVTEVSALASAPTQMTNVATPDAYDHYLLGRHLIVRREKTALEAAVEHFKTVLETNPDYAPAWSALGEATLLLEDAPCCYGDLSQEEVMARARPALERALLLDPNLAEAHAAMGLLVDNTDKEAALSYFARAIEINPNLARAHMWRSSTLTDIGRPAEGFATLERALRLDPLSTVANMNMARSLYLRSRFDESHASIDKVMQLSPGRGLGALAELERARGDRAAAMAAYLKAVVRYPDDPPEQDSLRHHTAGTGHERSGAANAG